MTETPTTETPKKQKRFIPISECREITGLSYPTIISALESKQFLGVQTETGHWKVDRESIGAAKVTIIPILERLDEQEQLIKALASHLGLRLEPKQGG